MAQGRRHILSAGPTIKDIDWRKTRLWSRRQFAKAIYGATSWGLASHPLLARGMQAPTGGLRVDGHRILAGARDLEVEFVGLGIARIHDRLTGKEYLNTVPTAHLLLRHKSNEGVLTEAELTQIRQISPRKVEIEYKPLSTGLPGAKVIGRVSVSDDAVTFGADVKLNQPGLTEVLHPLRELDNRNEVMLPVLGGVRFTGSDHPQLFLDPSSVESLLAAPKRKNKEVFTWPNLLSGCFLFYKAGNSGFWLRSEDEMQRFKAAHLDQTERTFNVSVGSQVAGATGECREFSCASWKLGVFGQDWERKLDDYVEYLRAKSPAWAYQKNTIPWVNDVRLVLNQFKVVEQDPSGQVHDNPALLKTDLELVKRLSDLIRPQQVIIYAFQWQLIPFEVGAGVGYPDWTPSPLFVRLAVEARKMGYHVMPHLNYFAISPKNTHYQDFEPYILREPTTGKKLGWLLDEEKKQGLAYLHPAAPGWFELQMTLVKQMLAAVPVDAIFWDQTLNILNAQNVVVNGKTTIQASIDFLRGFREAFPALAFGGEGVTEITVPYQDFVQAHTPGLYALTNGDPGDTTGFHWGLNPQTFPMRARMISRMYSNFTQGVGFAAEPDVHSPSFTDWIDLQREYRLVTAMEGLSMKDLDDPQGFAVKTIRGLANSHP